MTPTSWPNSPGSPRRPARSSPTATWCRPRRSPFPPSAGSTCTSRCCRLARRGPGAARDHQRGRPDRRHHLPARPRTGRRTPLPRPGASDRDQRPRRRHPGQPRRAGAKVLVDTLEDLAQGVSPTPQDERGASFAPKLTPADARIDWSRRPAGSTGPRHRPGSRRLDDPGGRAVQGLGPPGVRRPRSGTGRDPRGQAPPVGRHRDRGACPGQRPARRQEAHGRRRLGPWGAPEAGARFV